MEGSDKKEKKKLTNIKTFPIPLSKEKNKNHLSISTKPSYKLSKEELINIAFKFHSEGQLSEAAKYYQYFINQGFTDHRVFSHYGTILKNLGKFKAAELLYRKAIQIKPDFAEVHSNLGNILKDIGNLQDAENSYRKAIELNPYFADPLSNLGTIYKELGKLQDAENSYRKAIELKPNWQTYFFYAACLFERREFDIAKNKLLEAKSIATKNHHKGYLNGALKVTELAKNKLIDSKN